MRRISIKIIREKRGRCLGNSLCLGGISGVSFFFFVLRERSLVGWFEFYHLKIIVFFVLRWLLLLDLLSVIFLWLAWHYKPNSVLKKENRILKLLQQQRIPYTFLKVDIPSSKCPKLKLIGHGNQKIKG